MSQYKEFSIILYDEPTRSFLLNLGVEYYAYIKHDKDYNENGEIKKSHYHLYVKLYKKKTIGGVFNIVCRHFNINANLIEPIDNTFRFIRYLSHIDEEDKHIYNLDEITCNFDLSIYYNLKERNDNFVLEIISKIDRGEIKNFKELVKYCSVYGELERLMRNTYFFKCLF